MNNKDFKPYISAEKKEKELTPVSIVTGILLAMVFGAANAYLGLRVGMTVSASIPAAVISMGIIRHFLKRDSILENNMVQTIGSAGESLAAGAIFTMPALFMWAAEIPEAMAPTLVQIVIPGLCGGLLGVLFMVPLRRSLIVEEHDKLPFPEGTACAQVLLAGEKGTGKSKSVFAGLGISAVYKFFADGLRVFPSEIEWKIKNYGTVFGMDVLPALLGVGFICGLRIASFMFAGGVLGWFVLIPLIHMFMENGAWAVSGTQPVDFDAWSIWRSYIRYIGSGAVAAGGIFSLIRSLPVIVKTFFRAVKGIGYTEEEQTRTSRELPMKIVLGSIILIALVIWLSPSVPVAASGAVIVVVLGFFFAAVSSRMVGMVGSSNNPVSGMAIATLLIATAVLKMTGSVGYAGMSSAICIGTIVCIVAAMAGDTSQDLKTGFILGATPKKQQIGEIIGVLVSALTIGGVMYLLNDAWGYGSEELPAPQAMLMKLVVEGVMEGTLPWKLVFIGVFLAVIIEILGIPVLPVAIGLYLPLHLSVPIFTGGLLRKYVDQSNKKGGDPENVERGILYSSGLIAGEGLVGILLAVLAVVVVGGKKLSDYLVLDFSLGRFGGLIFFLLLCGTLVYSSYGRIKFVEKNDKIF